MSHYHHLSITDRECIWEKHIKGFSLRQIAACLGRSVSTISRELKRNSVAASYRPSQAQTLYVQRRQRCHRPLLLTNQSLRDTVVRLLSQEQWSPEQIAMRLLTERGRLLVSYPTIYRALKSGIMEPKGHRKNRQGRYPLEKHLRRKGWKGRRKGHQQKKTAPFVHQTIDQRPQEAETRCQFGHWEGDLVYSSFHKVYIITLVDRYSRYLLTDICENRKPSAIAAVMLDMLSKLPKERVRSITLDRGLEFAQHSKITEALPQAQFYFAHPHAPWERGTNENTNGLLRQYIPKETYKRPFSRELLALFTHKINHRPRKCLNWRTASEVFDSSLLHLT